MLALPKQAKKQLATQAAVLYDVHSVVMEMFLFLYG